MNIRIIISPAKTMEIDNDSLTHRQMPVFIDKSNMLLDYLQTLNYKELKSIWKCSDNLAGKNFNRIKDMDLYKNLTPSILAFEGLQYQYMGSEVFTYNQLDYIEEHLRILSGLYGILRPFDGIVPYRLEMKSKFIEWEYKSLYEFWEEKIAKSIFAETNCIINLASKEYSKTISKYLNKNIKFITCIFGEIIEGKVKQKATLAKMARGEMVRFMAENNLKFANDIKKFNRLNYIYKEELSDDNTYVFIKTK
ncbi:peroxide stress protein YaaA [Senegalia sp. (in: firmicutes)]|uniref:peroxide stress protein YaaA n=1 Tax=Senegalia sp. (in: firmicutes) TaxID=1924098 RepID=UPI003F96A9F6